MMTTVFAGAAIPLAAAMGCMFLIGLRARDNSLVDIAYGPALALACWGGWWFGGTPDHFRPLLLLTLVTLWAVRLGLHIGLRHRGRGEDFRYQAFREAWGETIVWRSFLQIYLLQGAVICIVALPILLNVADPGGAARWTDLLGFLLFVVGFLFEAVADWQLTRFKRNPAHRGRIIEEGLWRYSRHPNYFGEALLWWGLFCLGLGSPLGLWGVLSPLTIGFLLLKVSGIPMLEAKYAGNPQFEAYKARTSPFFPWFPKQPPPSTTSSPPETP